MPMYNLLEYNDNYSMTSGSLHSYYREEVNDTANEIILIIIGWIITRQQQVNLLSTSQK